MAFYRYKYLYKGEGEREVPSLKRIVQPQEVVASEEPINNSDFELLEEIEEGEWE